MRAAGLAAGLVLASASAATPANSCDPVGSDVMVGRADLIVLGKVERVRQKWLRPVSVAEVQTTRVLKGRAAPRRFVYEFSKGRIDTCGFEDFEVRPAGQYVFLLERTRKPSAYYALEPIDYRQATGAR